MYLMNVPPVAATRTEWRTCGPPGHYSLPICFNDSDTELSSRGSPISNKVQMIIESLRSTQSSLEMGDEIEGNVPPGQEGHPQVCKVAVGPYMGAKSKTKSPGVNQRTGVPSTLKHQSSDSDSDDSVDRGIEEAILEYLKEKDDHKRKAEPCAAFLQSSKVHKKNPPLPEVSKQRSNSSSFSIASGQFPRSVKAGTPTVPAVIPIKKYIKSKACLNDGAVKNLESNRAAKSLLLPKEQARSPSKTIRLFNKVKCPITVKVEDDSNDSSSDDGIEEAIQRYQLEKKELESRGEAFRSHALTEESDSTSDDGIEEAIRSYQLEQLKEKGVLKPLLRRSKPTRKSLMCAGGGTSAESASKRKLRKKKNRGEKEANSVLPPASSLFVPKDALAEGQRGKGNGLLSFIVEGYKDQPVPAPPKVNTTAELMCAEAILDISKTVMPGAFHHPVGLGACGPAESAFQSPAPDNCPDDESDDSSVDSEDGIEQEIMKFLEQKAQMHKQPPSLGMTQEPRYATEPEVLKTKQVVAHKKPLRLSLTQRRKYREENCSISSVSGADNNLKDASPKPLPGHRKELGPLIFSQRSQSQPTAGLHKAEQGGDKSSSLDSDEDLDTAIKDLLKTKKKSKKKTRDLKRNSRKCLKEEEPLLKSALPAKKLKPDPESKSFVLDKKVHKSKNGMKDGPALSRKATSQSQKNNTSKEQSLQEGDTRKFKGTEAQFAAARRNAAPHAEEDSSSVDSDDSIELEIRRFLAEKAEKVSTAEQSRDGQAARNCAVAVCTPPQDEGAKKENQLAEIPRRSMTPVSGRPPIGSPPSSRPAERQAHPAAQQSLAPDVPTLEAPPRLSSVRSRSPSPLEPADGAGAGAARPQQTRPSGGRGGRQDAATEMEKARQVSGLRADHARSECIKWRQSLGLPTADARTLSRTLFHITSSRSGEAASAAPLYQGRAGGLKPQTPAPAWPPARTSRTPFACSTDKAAHAALRAPVLNFLSAARQHQGMSSLAHRSQCQIAEAESMVHMPKDKSVFVELESDRTNHVQVRSRERIEGQERADVQSEIKREVQGAKLGDKEMHLEGVKEEFIDDSDCESGDRRNPVKKQGFSTLSLSRAIDPGITIKPCIALNTEERSSRFIRRWLPERYKKIQTVQRVKRKLVFVPVGRCAAAPPGKLKPARSEMSHLFQEKR